VPHDLALLKIEARNLPPIEFKSSKAGEVGNWIACVAPDNQIAAIGVISVATRNMSTKGFTNVDTSKLPYLGVGLESNEGGGVKIKEVLPNTPAAKNGFKANDVIIQLAGKQVDSPDEFKQAISKFKPGESVKFKLRRGDEEIERSAQLDRQPSNNRGDFQNKLGSELSSRRSGYGTILQHDSVVRPTDCGGPIVDLEGRVLGINICRAGRVESWAVPSEVIQPVLADMMAGKFPPKGVPALTPEQKLEKAKANVKRIEGDKSREKDLDEARNALKSAEAAVTSFRKKEAADATDRVLSLMQQRLVLMNDVASWKLSNGQDTADPLREKEMIAKLKVKAKSFDADSKEVERFFNAQFEAAKMLQQERIAEWTKEKATPKVAGDLTKELRPKIDKLNDELVETFAQVLRYRNDADLGVAARVRERSPQVVTGKGISDAVRKKATEGLLVP